MKHNNSTSIRHPTAWPWLFKLTKRLAVGYETQEKVNTHPPPPPPLLQADSSILSHLCLGLFWNQFFPGDYLTGLKDCVNALRTIYFQFEYEEQGKRRLLGWSRHNLKMCRSKDNACDFGKNQQRKPFFT